MRIVTDSIVGRGASVLVVEEGAPSYGDLLAENEMLKKALEQAKLDKEDLWMTIEDVCTGAKLWCEKCQQNHPCGCDTGPND